MESNFKVLLLMVIAMAAASTALELYKASQCFKSRGIPKVAFNCPPHHMIKIHRAFHGISDRERTPEEAEEQCPAVSEGGAMANCTQCEGDCIDDSMNLVYDWSTCMGNTSCIRTVMQSYMPACPGRDKFSDYLQVEYQCVPRVDVINICQKVEKTLQEGYIFSPNYPHNYPTNQDCMCRIYTDWSSRVRLSMYDLLLETKNGRCRADWLMLRQKEQKHRHCGAIMTGTKNITSDSNTLEIQFHSDENDNRTQNFQYFTRSLKGFWVYFSSVPRGSLKIACRQLTPADQEVREIVSDDEEFEEVVGKDLPTTEMPLDGITKVMSDDEEGEDASDEGDKKGGAKDDKKNGHNGTKKRPGRPQGKKGDKNHVHRDGEKGANRGANSAVVQGAGALASILSLVLATVLH